jgi:pimeloyl-ACP methyl ester carboxylesterase
MRPGRSGATLLEEAEKEEADVTIGHHTTGTRRAGSSYVDANGVHTYYEVEGTGEPLVLLHGGLCAIETLAGLCSGLAERYQVYRPERRGHGRTPDVEGAFSYGLFAEDTIAFVEALGLESVHVVGFSDGATVGLLTALRRPDLVRSLVHIGQQANPSGMPAEFQEVIKLDAMPQGMLPPMLRDLYSSLSPDGADHWDVIVDKEWQMIKSGEPNLDPAELGGVKAPTLVMLGDHDMVTEAHAAEMARAIPTSKLIVVPDATHALPMEKPEIVAPAVIDFLAEG